MLVSEVKRAFHCCIEPLQLTLLVIPRTLFFSSSYHEGRLLGQEFESELLLAEGKGEKLELLINGVGNEGFEEGER